MQRWYLFLSHPQTPVAPSTGLVQYGAIEVFGAALVVANGGSDFPVMANALGVQAAVAASWLYSSKR